MEPYGQKQFKRLREKIKNRAKSVQKGMSQYAAPFIFFSPQALMDRP
jgi:hypothetical protein